MSTEPAILNPRKKSHVLLLDGVRTGNVALVQEALKQDVPVHAWMLRRYMPYEDAKGVEKPAGYSTHASGGANKTLLTSSLIKRSYDVADVLMQHGARSDTFFKDCMYHSVPIWAMELAVKYQLDLEKMESDGSVAVKPIEWAMNGLIEEWGVALIRAGADTSSLQIPEKVFPYAGGAHLRNMREWGFLMQKEILRGTLPESDNPGSPSKLRL